MPAPTALQRRPEELADNVALEASSISLPTESDGDLISMSIDPVDAPNTTSDAPEEDMPMVDESGSLEGGGGGEGDLGGLEVDRGASIGGSSTTDV